MGKLLKIFRESLLAVVVFFFLAEGACLGLGIAPGMEDFVQAIVIRERLTTYKPQNEVRVFTYGESTMHGAHYGPVSSPARWLETYLKDFLPDRKIRVVNFARLGHGIDYTRLVFQESLYYKPDIAIFYNGHNDFLRNNRLDHVETEHRSFKSSFIALVDKSRFISLIYRQLVRYRMARKKAKQGDLMGHEVIEAETTGVKGTYDTIRDEEFYRKNVQFFRHTVKDIQALAEKKKVHTLFLNPVSNLKDFAPIGSYHKADLSAENLGSWELFFEQGKQLQKSGQHDAALEKYNQAYALDPVYAELSFRMGQAYYSKAEYGKARQFFEQARDHDLNIVRATSDIQNVLSDLQKRSSIKVVDTENILKSEAPNGILGLPVVEDNVHFSIKGHQLVGRALAYEIAENGWIAPKTEWKFERERPFKEISEELGINNDLLVSAFIKMADYFANRSVERISYARKAVELEPENPYALRALAWAYWLSGQRQEAAGIYGKLKRVDQKSYTEIMEHFPEVEKVMTQVS